MTRTPNDKLPDVDARCAHARSRTGTTGQSGGRCPGRALSGEGDVRVGHDPPILQHCQVNARARAHIIQDI